MLASTAEREQARPKVNEAFSKLPVSIANCIVSAIALGGCNDCALLDALRDSWHD